jgi:hypothetical protein
MVTKGSFKLELSARHRRCNITHTVRVPEILTPAFPEILAP